jgi:hypothetical protein
LQVWEEGVDGPMRFGMKRKMFSYGCSDAAALFGCVATPLPLARCGTSDIAGCVCSGVFLEPFESPNCVYPAAWSLTRACICVAPLPSAGRWGLMVDGRYVADGGEESVCRARPRFLLCCTLTSNVPEAKDTRPQLLLETLSVCGSGPVRKLSSSERDNDKVS